MKVGDRLILGFTRGGAHSGHAPVVCVAPGERTSQVVRVMRQDHNVDHAPTHYRRLAVASTRLRQPTSVELADESNQLIWDAIAEREEGG